MIVIHGEGNSDHSAGDDDDGLGGGKSAVAQMLIERAPSGRADGGHGGIVRPEYLRALTPEHWVTSS